MIYLTCAFISLILSCSGLNIKKGYDIDSGKAVLYDKKYKGSGKYPELELNGAASIVKNGLLIHDTGKLVKLDKFYAVAERKIRYTVRFSSDAMAIFRSSEGDFRVMVNLPEKKISIATSPSTETTVDFLEGDRDYLLEIYHVYQQAIVRIVDTKTGKSAEVRAVNDGTGGTGKGLVQTGFSVGMQWDYYCFGLQSGTNMVIKRIQVYALKNNVRLLMYGDSITQPEAYFPTKDFPQAWTQLIINKLKGDAISSGRGGANIDMLMGYIKNELPFIRSKYVMVTIGTNGGNTEEKLQELVDYIKSQGCIPILNNIPSNESGTQVTENILIEKVRKKNNLQGCLFDLATSLTGDGKEVDKSTMYWEDYTGSYGWQIYHHPNEKGGIKMFIRSLLDVPAVYE